MALTDIEKIEKRIQEAFNRETQESFNKWLTDLRDTRAMAETPNNSTSNCNIPPVSSSLQHEMEQINCHNCQGCGWKNLKMLSKRFIQP